ncbi:MAG: hypothetical protein AAGK78_06930, partial [Planctomycetota bacterium]
MHPSASAAVTAATIASRRGLASAHASFLRDGVLCLHQVIERAAVEAAHRRFIERYAGLGEDELRAVGSRVGHERYMISVDW